MKKKLIALLEKHGCELYEGDNGKVDMIAPDSHLFATVQATAVVLISPPAFGFVKPSNEDWKNAYSHAQAELLEGIYEEED